MSMIDEMVIARWAVGRRWRDRDDGSAEHINAHRAHFEMEVAQAQERIAELLGKVCMAHAKRLQAQYWLRRCPNVLLGVTGININVTSGGRGGAGASLACGGAGGGESVPKIISFHTGALS